jgi:hypothetical protein
MPHIKIWEVPKNFSRRPEGRDISGRTKHRWIIIIIIIIIIITELKEVSFEVMDYIRLAQVNVQWRIGFNMFINIEVPYNFRSDYQSPKKDSVLRSKFTKYNVP